MESVQVIIKIFNCYNFNLTEKMSRKLRKQECSFHRGFQMNKQKKEGLLKGSVV